MQKPDIIAYFGWAIMSGRFCPWAILSGNQVGRAQGWIDHEGWKTGKRTRFPMPWKGTLLKNTGVLNCTLLHTSRNIDISFISLAHPSSSDALADSIFCQIHHQIYVVTIEKRSQLAITCWCPMWIGNTSQYKRGVIMFGVILMVIFLCVFQSKFYLK